MRKDRPRQQGLQSKNPADHAPGCKGEAGAWQCSIREDLGADSAQALLSRTGYHCVVWGRGVRDCTSTFKMIPAYNWKIN